MTDSTFSVPVLGFVAFSGTGKTTLLGKLIPLLKERGIRLALIKHSHHDFEIDHKGKDSYELRQAGAEQVVIASKQRIAWIAELQKKKQEPCLREALQALNVEGLDLVLVEGFKGESYPKIEIHRSAMGKPFLYPDDSDIIACISDASAANLVNPPALLGLNDPASIVMFVRQWLAAQ